MRDLLRGRMTLWQSSPCHRPFCEDVEQQELGNRIIWTVTHYSPREGVGWFTFSVPGCQCVDWQRGTTRYKSGLQRYTPGILQVHTREVAFKIWESVAKQTSVTKHFRQKWIWALQGSLMKDLMYNLSFVFQHWTGYLKTSLLMYCMLTTAFIQVEV